MKLITWNIQWGRGIDDHVDLDRVMKAARAIADFDVLCLQEVADNFPGLQGNDDRDQFAWFADALPGFNLVAAPSVDHESGASRRRRFGVAIFSRYPVITSRAHALPWPADPGKDSMPRSAAEATLRTPLGPLRVTTTHLEYYSEVQRNAQAARLREINDEACDRAKRPGARTEKSGPFEWKPPGDSAILMGDFNCRTDSAAYADIQKGAFPYRDAWKIANGDKPHDPTFCLHDQRYAKEPYACDFIFVCGEIASRVKRVVVDSATMASDHQPVLIEIEES